MRPRSNSASHRTFSPSLGPGFQARCGKERRLRQWASTRHAARQADSSNDGRRKLFFDSRRSPQMTLSVPRAGFSAADGISTDRRLAAGIISVLPGAMTPILTNIAARGRCVFGSTQQARSVMQIEPFFFGMRLKRASAPENRRKTRLRLKKERRRIHAAA